MEACFSSHDHVCKILLGFFQVENRQNHSLHNYCNYGNCSRDFGNHYENDLSHHNDDNYHNYNNYYRDDDNYQQNCDNCYDLFALCLGISLMCSFVTGYGCQPVDNDLHYDNVVSSHDTRLDVCCTGLVSSSFSPDLMQHAL